MDKSIPFIGFTNFLAFLRTGSVKLFINFIILLFLSGLTQDKIALAKNIIPEKTKK